MYVIVSYSRPISLQDEILKIPIPATKNVERGSTVGSEIITITCSAITVIPVTVIGGKTRLLRPNTNCEGNYKFSIHLINSNEIFTLINSLISNKNEKSEISRIVSRFNSAKIPSFDLTSLTSHREVVKLSQPIRITLIKKLIEK